MRARVHVGEAPGARVHKSAFDAEKSMYGENQSVNSVALAHTTQQPA